MPMREECKHFQSRTYRSGEAVRFCVLDLAPEAPWRCPDECPKYEMRLADVGWVTKPLVRPPVPAEPEIIEASDDAVAMLDEAEDIINSVGPSIVADVQEQRARQRGELRESPLDKIKRRLRRR